LESLVWEEVVRQLSNPAVIMEALEAGNNQEQEQADEAEAKRLDGQQAKLDREADKLVDLYLSDGIERQPYDKRMHDISKRRDSINVSRNAIVARATERKQAQANAELVEELCRSAQLGLPYVDYAEKQHFLEAMNMRGEVDGRSVHITGLVTDAILSLTSSVKGANHADGVPLHTIHR
jgi:hypothetical protein